jgi:hypothetical protein
VNKSSRGSRHTRLPSSTGQIPLHHPARRRGRASAPFLERSAAAGWKVRVATRSRLPSHQKRMPRSYAATVSCTVRSH